MPSKRFRHFLTARNIAVLLLCVLLLSLIPVVYAARYAHPVYDDLYYSVNWSAKAPVSAGSFFSAIISGILKAYYTWQGTFSSILMFSLQPGIWSDGAYWLTALMTVLSLCLSSFFFFRAITRAWKQHLSHAAILSCLTSLFTIQFMYNKSEAFYWYNGSVHYLFFYSLSLLLFSGLITLYDGKKPHRLRTVLLCLLAFFIGGGNYTTALFTAEVLFLLVLWCFVKKHPRRGVFTVLFLVFMLSFVINMIAPGNQSRASVTQSTSAPMAVIKSLLYGAGFIVKWTGLGQVVFAICALPFVYRLAKACPLRFRHPVIMLLVGFGLFCSQLTPPLFALSTVGAPRQINLYYASYYLLVLYTLFVLCGAFLRRDAAALPMDAVKGFLSRRLGVLLMVLILLFGCGCYQYGVKNIACVDTTLALLDGSARQYSEEYKAMVRETVETAPDAVVTPFKTCPDFLNDPSLSTDPTDWINTSWASYYGVSTVAAGE